MTRDYSKQMVCVGIKAYPRARGKTDWHARGQLLRSYEMPRSQYDRWTHRLRWIEAYWQYRMPQFSVKMSISFFEQDGIDGKLKWRVASQKGQVTKIRNAMDRFAATYQPTLLIESHEKTETWAKLACKLEAAERKLKAAEEALANAPTNQRENPFSKSDVLLNS